MLFGIHPRVHNRCRTLHHACNPLATCVAVRRCDRCTRTFSFHFLVLLFWFVCISPSLYNVPELPYTSTKVKRTTHQSTVGAALCPFGGFVVPLICYHSWDRCCVVLLSVRLVVFLVLLYSSLCLGGPCRSVVWLLSLFFLFPSSRGLSCSVP